MPQVIRPSNITIVNGPDGSGKLLVTLELNINLNTNGVQVAAQEAAPAPVREVAPPQVPAEPVPEESDDFNFAIPEFTPVGRVKFGKEVQE